MRVAAYYRVSTPGQGDDDRLGIPLQREAVEGWCAEHGHELIATYADIGHSGSNPDRPQLAALLANEGFEGVVVYRWDRLARGAILDGWLRYSLQQRGVTVYSATEANGIDPTSVMVQAIQAAVAGYERHLITQRLAGARRLKASRGGYAHGQPRYGTRSVGGALASRDDEAQALAVMQALRAAGFTLRAIADELNTTDYRPRRAERWCHASVRGALRAASAAVSGAA
jgi:DNA invertase Pin-like site-specific DNA recombinase